MDTSPGPDLAPPPEWVAVLDRAEADVAAGQIVFGDEARQRLRASIARMEAKRGQVAEAGPSPLP